MITNINILTLFLLLIGIVVVVVGIPMFILGKIAKYSTTKTCPACRSRISNKASVCPFCRGEVKSRQIPAAGKFKAVNIDWVDKIIDDRKNSQPERPFHKDAAGGF